MREGISTTAYGRETSPSASKRKGGKGQDRQKQGARRGDPEDKT